MIIDAEDAPVGRLASIAAKAAREGEEVIIINAEKAIFKRSKQQVLQDLVEKKNKGTPNKGPFISFSSVKIVERAIRGMIGRKKANGREAFRRIKVYFGIPEGIDKSKAVKLFNKEKYKKYPTVGEISKLLGYE